MSEQTIKIGDIVTLRSGSPNLTVVGKDISEGWVPRITVAWIDDRSAINEMTAPLQCFRLEVELKF